MKRGRKKGENVKEKGRKGKKMRKGEVRPQWEMKNDVLREGEKI
jgi:hypothetical protein